MKFYRCKSSRLLFFFVLAFASLYLINHLGLNDVAFVSDDKNNVGQRKLLWEQADEKRFRELRLKRGANDVPVVIVDQHQEVIPYWFKAADEGIIPRYGNTLIHIDGHSDMAPPMNYTHYRQFQYKQNMAQNEYLPLMQSNDGFIISAIMTGLIERVIFVQPDWNDDANITQKLHGYVGLHHQSTSLCLCLRKIKSKKKKKKRSKKYFCDIFHPDIEDDDEIQEDVNSMDCPKMKSFSYYVIGELKFQKLLNLKKHKNIIVDIDEDYFGVESGVQNFINQGVELKTQEMLDEFLSRMFCPQSVEEEILLNRQLKAFFLSAFHLNLNSVDNNEQQKKLRDELFQYTGRFICDEEDIADFVFLIIKIDDKQLKALSNAEYCMSESPRLQKNNQEITSSGFSVCHGTIFPEDTLNKIHVGSNAEIDNRASNLKRILEHVSSFITPKIYTICRSLRDGYTPRRQQRYIEKQLTQAVAEVNEANGQNQNLVYDSQLVFGKDGWLIDEKFPSISDSLTK